MSAHPHSGERRRGDRDRGAKPIALSNLVPPHDLDAEAAVISAILTDGARSLDAVREVLPSGEPFYGDSFGRIFDAAIAVHDRSQPVDVTTVAGELRDRNRLQAIGDRDGRTNGITFLVSLANSTPSVAHVASHAAIVRDKWRVRMLIEKCSKIVAEGHGDYGTAADFIARAQGDVSSIVEASFGNRIESTADVARRRDIEIAEQWNGKRDPWGMRGSCALLHAKSHGYQVAEQTYLASDTGGGKSVFAMQETLTLATRTYNEERVGCGYLSLEMKNVSHYDRAIVQLTHRIARKQKLPVKGVTLTELMTGHEGGDPRNPKLDPGKLWLIEEARRVWRELPIDLDETPKDPTTIRATARMMQRRLHERGARLRFLVIDHMHIVDFPDADTEAAAIAKMVKGFNELAKELEIHLLVLAQFKREAITRGGRPRVDDIRGSGAIEQIAQKIFLIFRPFVRLADPSQATEEEKREAELIIGKHRNGKKGLVPMNFDGDGFWFDEAEDDNGNAADAA